MFIENERAWERLMIWTYALIGILFKNQSKFVKTDTQLQLLNHFSTQELMEMLEQWVGGMG
jgi:hypothetical protein